MASKALTAEDYAFSRLIAYAAYQWPGYKDAYHHRLIARHLEMVERGDITRLMITMPPRHGKALHVDTPIPTPTGWKRIADLRPGDRVFDESGKPCNVVAVSDVWEDRAVYSVITDDGDEIIADAEHEWLVRLCRKRPVFKNKTTKQLALRAGKRAPMVERQGYLDLPKANLPIGPYTLGCWLGDGTSLDGAITGHDSDQVLMRPWIEEEGYTTTTRNPPTLYGVLGLKARLRELGLLGNKHIPSQYLFASRAQRLSLLQGLIDTDGYVAKDGQVEFCNMDRDLAFQVKELVASLGSKASIVVGRATLNGRDCGEKYRVMFYLAHAARLPRKATRCRDGVKRPHRYLQRIEPAGTADTVCIQVDSPSHMFLCGRSMLPTHNSMLASEFFPAWYMGRNPDHYVVTATYAQELADDFGRKVKNQIEDEAFQLIFPGVGLADDSKSAKRFHVEGRAGGLEHQTTQRGAFYAVGVGGPLTGRGAHLLLIDDPVKNREDAESEVIRKKTKDWYTSTAYTRLMPGGRIVVIQTRWHCDDLSGWLLEEHGHENWTVLNLPAINDEGEALWPEQYPVEALEKIKLAVGPRDWSALYQQRPSPESGDYFKREWIIPVEHIPPKEEMSIYGGSDYAVTADGGDYTVHAVLGVAHDGRMYLLDLWRQQASSDVWVDAFCALVRKWKPIGWAEETGQIKSGVGPFLVKRMLETGSYTVREQFPTRGDKAIRAQSIRGRMAMQGLHVPKDAPWLSDFISELMSFPVGVHDDQVDSIGLVGQLLDRTEHGNKPRDVRGTPSPIVIQDGIIAPPLKGRRR